MRYVNKLKYTKKAIYYQSKKIKTLQLVSGGNFHCALPGQYRAFDAHISGKHKLLPMKKDLYRNV